MTIKTTVLDSSEQMKTDEDVQLYLDNYLKEAGDDPSFIIHALGAMARAKGMNQLVIDTGITKEDLYKAFTVDGNPTFATIAIIIRALGLKFSVQVTQGREL